ncbi:MAG: 30S ribosomal protein S6 [Anaerolineae bacterium]|nr:30S ribosomal protein S6 [Anaerolineae bacterium]
MRNYELTYIIHPDLADDARPALIRQVEDWIKAGGGSVQKTVDWGRRRLAYRIKNQREGHYIHVLVELDTNAVPDLERNLKFNENILRHLLVRTDD